MNANTQTHDEVADERTVEPLRKEKDGELYARPAAIELSIAELMRLTKAEFVHRIKDLVEPVPSEVLLYFVRRPPFAADQAVLFELFTAIRQRVQKAVPVPKRRIRGQSKLVEHSVDAEVREAVLDKFQEMLCKDRQEYLERLDFFECRFNAAIHRLRLTARRDICKEAQQIAPLVHDNETSELDPEVEKALSCITDSFDGPKTDFLYRSKIHAAINSLPLDERRVVELYMEDMPINPQGTDAMTMVKILGCREETVRNRRKRAFAKLAELLKEEDA